MSMTIVEFIRARLDEDEAAANANDGARWPDISGNEDFGYKHWYDGHGELIAYSDSVDEPLVRHMSRHDPARVLAQVAAMRAIVQFHESWPVLVETEPELSTATDDTGSMTVKMAKQVAWMTEREYRERFGDEPPTAPMLRHLAAIWSDHDDYNPAWSPTAA